MVRKTTYRWAVFVGGLCAFSACNLPPLPGFSAFDAGSEEQDVAGPGSPVCEPASRLCVANTVRVCTSDGLDFAIEPCGVGETCAVGRCEPIANACDGDQPFALSSRELAFEATKDFKLQTKQLSIRNCTARPIVLREFEVRGPQRPDGTPVFVPDTELANTTIPAGGTTGVKVAYRPVAGLSHVTGRVELGLIVDELVNVEVALRSKALCMTATPYVDLGMRLVDSEIRASAFVQNCGTEPIAVSGWSAPDGVDVTFDELPTELVAGETLRYDVALEPSMPGLLDANVTLETSEVALSPTTRVRGIAVYPGCVDEPLSDAQILSNNLPLPPTPGSLVRARFPDAGPSIYHWLEPLGQPQGSLARLDRVADGWALKPRVVGRYRSTLRGYDVQTGQPTCDLENVAFDVKPLPGLHVELSWLSSRDPIPEDTDFGRAANLDLHVLRAVDQGRGRWNDPGADCWPGISGPCIGEGRMFVSQGGLAEFVHLAEVDGRYQVGVYMSNPFNFAGSLARVRVYRNDVLVAELESTSLRSANDFWLVGQWDEGTQTWSAINSVFSGFPY